MLTRQELQIKIAEFNSLVNKSSQDYKVYYNRTMFLLGHYHELLALGLNYSVIIRSDLNKIIELTAPYIEDPNLKIVLISSYLYRHLCHDNYQAAINDIDEAIELQASGHLFIMSYRLQLAKNLDISENFIENYKKLIDAINLYNDKDYPRALSIYNDLIHADVNNPASYIYRGRIYAEINEGEKADQDYNTAIKLINAYKPTSQTDNRYLKQLLSIAFLEKGINRSDYVSAQHEIKKAAEINPDNYEAYIMLVDLYMQQATYGNIIAAEQLLLSMKDNIPPNLYYKKIKARFYEKLGNVYLLKGDYLKMRGAYEHALELDIDKMEDILLAAYYYTYNNDKHEAQYWLKRIQTVNPQQASSEKILRLFNTALDKGINSVVKGINFPPLNPKMLPSKGKPSEEAQNNFSTVYFYLLTAGTAALIIALFYLISRYYFGKQRQNRQKRPDPVSPKKFKKHKPAKQESINLSTETVAENSATSANQFLSTAEVAAAEEETAKDKALNEIILKEKEEAKKAKRRAKQRQLQEKEEKERRLKEVERKAKEKKEEQKYAQARPPCVRQDKILNSAVQSEASTITTTTTASTQKSAGSVTFIINNPDISKFFTSTQTLTAKIRKDTVDKQKYLARLEELEPEQKQEYKSLSKMITTKEFPCLRDAEDYLKKMGEPKPSLLDSIELAEEQVLLFHKCFILGNVIRTFVQILEGKDKALIERLGGHIHLMDIRNRLVHYSYLILAKDIKVFKDAVRKLAHILEGKQASYTIINLTKLLPLLDGLPQMSDLASTLTPQSGLPTAEQILLLLDKLQSRIVYRAQNMANHNVYFTSATAIMIFSTIFKDLQQQMPDFERACQADKSLYPLLHKGRELRNIFAHDTEDLPPEGGDYTITEPLMETDVAQFAEMASKGIVNLSELINTLTETEERTANVCFSRR